MGSRGRVGVVLSLVKMRKTKRNTVKTGKFVLFAWCYPYKGGKECRRSPEVGRSPLAEVGRAGPGSPIEYSATMKDRDSIFQNVIGDDWTICQNCFRRTHKSREIDPRKQKKSRRGVLDQVVSKTKEADTTYTEDGKKTGCECGSIDRSPMRRPLRKEVAAKYARNLANRLQEEGYSVSCTRLRRIVKRLKSEGSHHGRDNRFFDIAVEEAFNPNDEGKEHPN